MKNIHRAMLPEKYLAILTYCLWLSPLCFPHFMNAQPQTFRFTQLSNETRLSQNWVHDICQDKQGFIWIGTEDGLNRYDGYSFTVYKHDRDDENTLSNSAINSLLTDSKDNLWVGTSKGLNLFDRYAGRFIHKPHWPQSVIRAIVEYDQGKVLVATNEGLYLFNVKGDSAVIYRSNDPVMLDEGYLSSNVINALLVDSKKNIWVGTNMGVNLLDLEKNSVINYYHEESDPNSIATNDIRSIVEDSTGRIWLGTGTGLALFTNAKDRPAKGKFIHYRNNQRDKNSISGGIVLDLLADNKNSLWIGIENGGLDMLDLNLFNNHIVRFNHFRSNPNRAGGLNNNSIYSLYQDRQSNIWIGTFGKGVNIISPIGDKFTQVSNEPDNQNSLSNNNVNTFFEEKDFLWIGTEGGLNRYDKRTGAFKHFTHNPDDPSSIGSNAVWAINKDRRGNLWVGTWRGGLNLYNYKTETFSHYYNNPLDSNSLGNNNIFSLMVDSQDRLWIGTMGGGLNEFDYDRKKFIRYNEITSNISSNYVQALLETKNGDLWLSNVVSLERFDKVTKQFKHYVPDSSSLIGVRVISLFQDSRENIWVGTDEALNVYNKSTDEFSHYRMQDGLPSNYIVSINEDNRGNLWIGTNNGLSKFVNGVNLPPEPEFKNYTMEDGLQANEFTRRASYKDAGGNLYFGGVNGFNVFNPENIISNTYVPPVVVTDFQIFNKPVTVGTEDSPLQQNISLTEKLELSYKQSVFSFDFVALNYISSPKNQYAYKMEGFDEEWNYVGTKRSASYTNLDPGEYIFRVKGSNNDGVWNEQSVSIRIVITPPFWQTLWFKIFVAVVLLGIVFWMYKRWLRARELAEKIRLDEVVTKERNMLRTLIDNMPDAIYVKDLQCRKTITNPADLENIGIASEQEVLGKDDFEFFPKELAERFYADDQHIITTGQPIINREEYVFDRNGERRWLNTSKLPLFNKEKQIIGLIGIGRDVTEKKRAEETLQNERNLLRMVIDNLPDGVYTKDLNYRKTLANKVDVYNMGRKSEDEVLGKDDYELFPKEMAESFIADDRLVIQTGQPVINREEYVIDAKGQKHFLLTTKLPFRNEQGQIIGLIGIGRDVTEKKRAEETLQNERNLLRALIDNVPDYVYVKDSDGRFIIGNTALVRQIGLNTESELLGKTDFDIFPHELAEKYAAAEKEILNSGKGKFEYEGPTIDTNKDTKDRWVSTTKVPFKDAQSKIIGTVGIGRDITLRKRIEEEREILITELQNALADVKVLSGLVPICSNCKKIRDDSGFWNQLESYIQKHSQAKFSHGICPDCMAELYPDIQIKTEKGKE